MKKYYYLNKEISMASGEVVVRLVSYVKLTREQVNSELQDNNWFEYESATGDLPYYIKYTNNNGVESIDINPPAGAMIKHMYAGIDMYKHMYHVGNLDISQFKQQADNINYNTQKIYVESGKPALSTPNNTGVSSETTDGKEKNIIKLNKDNKVEIGDSDIDTIIKNNTKVEGNLNVGEDLIATHDVLVKRTDSNGKTQIVSMYDLNTELEKLKKEVELLKQMDGTPIGTIMAFPNIESIPLDYIICDGRTYDVNIYKDLYSLLKTNKVPDLRGSFMRGLDLGKGLDPGRMPVTWQKGTTGAIPHKHITGMFDDNTDDNWVAHQDTNENIGDVNSYNWIGRRVCGDERRVNINYNTRIITGRSRYNFTMTHDKVFTDPYYQNNAVRPDNVSVIFAMKAINLNGKATGQSDGRVGSGQATQPGQGSQQLSPSQNLQLTLILQAIINKYDKTGGTINGSLQAQSDFRCNGEVIPHGGAWFQDFNDISEYFDTNEKISSGYVVSLIDNDKYGIRSAKNSDYIAGITISKDETAILMGAENETNTPIALKGRVYVYSDTFIKKGTHVYLSETIPGRVGVNINKHYVGLTVTDTVNGMNRVLVRT